MLSCFLSNLCKGSAVATAIKQFLTAQLMLSSQPSPLCAKTKRVEVLAFLSPGHPLNSAERRKRTSDIIPFIFCSIVILTAYSVLAGEFLPVWETSVSTKVELWETRENEPTRPAVLDFTRSPSSHPHVNSKPHRDVFRSHPFTLVRWELCNQQLSADVQGRRRIENKKFEQNMRMVFLHGTPSHVTPQPNGVCNHGLSGFGRPLSPCLTDTAVRVKWESMLSGRGLGGQSLWATHTHTTFWFVPLFSPRQKPNVASLDCQERTHHG